MDINEILNQKHYNLMELILCCEQVKNNGDVVVIKFDGERTSNGYTVFIAFPSQKREMIRADDDSLLTALEIVLKEYIKM